MASSQELLLPTSTTSRKTCLPCKTLSLFLSLAAVICLASFITIQVTTTTDSSPLQPSDLCTNSPNPTSCYVIVSDALMLSAPRPTPLNIFTSLVEKSLLHLNSATTSAGELRRRINDPRQQSALADCILLMDLSHDRLASSAAAASRGSHTDARTWLSAVLANHGTCLDGLDGSARSDMEADLKALMDIASASLAVLNAVSSTNRDEAIGPVFEFPSWLSHRDRKLLETTDPNAISANVVVAKDGSGKFKTVQEAVNSAPEKGKNRFVIYVKKGIYKENVVLGKTKTNVMIVGDAMDDTIISGSLNFVDGTTTFNSATLAANGDGLILQDLKVENTAGAVKHQAVALRVSADRSVINRCKIEGYQDTLYAHTLRQFYRDTTISGTVDFIFGDAAVVIQDCNLIARKPMAKQQNLVTAQGRLDPNQNTGTSIQNCKIMPAVDLIPVKGSIPTYLGRPWKQYSRTVVMQSFIESHVNPLGWMPWDGDFALNTLFYGEYMNKGPGAGTAGRVKWAGYRVITDARVASLFTVASLIQGGSWLPSTGVGFLEGL